ncbi:jg16717 [Pararge aegeria aegeria]|uniref:Jg16717 protein n=1 Tax=Pararge aegeria aegeria TaxID=348720 RepID=A0A8S4S4X0_9NEOP|nr:jg16717 [Pararge aegeria aegeria]
MGVDNDLHPLEKRIEENEYGEKFRELISLAIATISNCSCYYYILFDGIDSPNIAGHSHSDVATGKKMPVGAVGRDPAFCVQCRGFDSHNWKKIHILGGIAGTEPASFRGSSWQPPEACQTPCQDPAADLLLEYPVT